MGSFKSTFLWFLLSLAAATFAQPDHELQSLHLNTIGKRGLDTFSLHKRCVGTCQECFGESYQECASSSSLCFKPGDPQHGEETCSESGSTIPTVPTSSSSSGSDSSGTTPSSSSDSPAPLSDSDSSSTAGSNITTTDFCDNGSFDCRRCFGSTFIPCPDAPDSYCYDPNNSTSICPDSTSPGGSSGSSSSSGSAAGSGSSPTQSSAATGPSNAGTNAVGSTTSPASGNSGTSSATGSGQTSTTSGGSNGNSASASTNGQPSSAEGMFGVLAVLALCFTLSAGFIF